METEGVNAKVQRKTERMNECGDAHQQRNCLKFLFDQGNFAPRCSVTTEVNEFSTATKLHFSNKNFDERDDHRSIVFLNQNFILLNVAQCLR